MGEYILEGLSAEEVHSRLLSIDADTILMLEAQVIYTAMTHSEVLDKPSYRRIKKFYDKGLWSADIVFQALECGLIDRDDYDKIMGN